MSKPSKQSTLFQSWGVPNIGRGVARDGVQRATGSTTTVPPADDWADDDTPDDVLLNIALHDDTTADVNPTSTAAAAAGFDREAGRLWIYPTNYPVREYQWSIIAQALFHNTLVVLPTGLGKTFIAAVVMYNFYRWFPQASVVFMAPTKPLVAQQIGACYDVMGIPPDDTAEMTGAMPPGKRREAWRERRVFYLTPQVLMNDMSRGACVVDSLRCLVVDEAHKATGNHAYCQVVRELAKHKANCRVLALSATPGSNIKCVQEVVTNLLIAHIELRTEQSADIKPYTHERTIEKVVVDLSEEMKELKQTYLQIVTTVVERLQRARAIYKKDVESLSKFSILKARDEFRQNPPHNIPRAACGAVEADFALCISLYHGLQLLQLHGLRSLHSYLSGLLSPQHAGSYTRSQLSNNPAFQRLMAVLADRFTPIRQAVPHTQATQADGQSAPASFGHPKMEKLQQIVLDHFKTFRSDAGDSSTRIMIFSQYRDSVSEIAEMLGHHRPAIRVISFIGQSSAGNNARGFTQKEQLRVMREFRSGGYNTLVATCVGEEGLDIGDVDLIVCFDAHKSPIRLVQRMGRTGRKRKGRIVMLLTKGKEEQVYNQSQYNKRSVDRAIGDGTKSLHMYAFDQRMVAADIQPRCHKMHVTVPQRVEEEPRSKRATARTKKSGPSANDKASAASGFLTESETRTWRERYQVDESTLPRLATSHMLSMRHRSERGPSLPPCQRPSFSLRCSTQLLGLQRKRLVTPSMKSQHMTKLIQFMIFQEATGDAGVEMYDEEMQSYLVADDVMPRRRQEKGLKRYLLPAETTQQTKKRPLDDLSDHPAFEPSKKVKRSDQLPRFSSSDDDDDLPPCPSSVLPVMFAGESRIAPAVSLLEIDDAEGPVTRTETVVQVASPEVPSRLATRETAEELGSVRQSGEEDGLLDGHRADESVGVSTEMIINLSDSDTADNAEEAVAMEDNNSPDSDKLDFEQLFPSVCKDLLFSPDHSKRVSQSLPSDHVEKPVASPPTDEDIGSLSAAFRSKTVSETDMLCLIDEWENERQTGVLEALAGSSTKGRKSAPVGHIPSATCHQKASVAVVDDDSDDSDDCFKGTSDVLLTNDYIGLSCRNKKVSDIGGSEMRFNRSVVSGTEPRIGGKKSELGTSQITVGIGSKATHGTIFVPPTRALVNTEHAACLNSTVEPVLGVSRTSCVKRLPAASPTREVRAANGCAVGESSLVDVSVFSFSQALACVQSEDSEAMDVTACTGQRLGLHSRRLASSPGRTETVTPVKSARSGPGVTTSTPYHDVQTGPASPQQSPLDDVSGTAAPQRRTDAATPRRSTASRPHAAACSTPQRRDETTPSKCLASPTFPCSGRARTVLSPTFPDSWRSNRNARDASPELFEESVGEEDIPNFSLGLDVAEEPDFDLGFDVVRGSDDDISSDVDMENLSDGHRRPSPTEGGVETKTGPSVDVLRLETDTDVQRRSSPGKNEKKDEVVLRMETSHVPRPNIDDHHAVRESGTGKAACPAGRLSGEGVRKEPGIERSLNKGNVGWRGGVKEPASGAAGAEGETCTGWLNSRRAATHTDRRAAGRTEERLEDKRVGRTEDGQAGRMKDKGATTSSDRRRRLAEISRANLSATDTSVNLLDAADDDSDFQDEKMSRCIRRVKRTSNERLKTIKSQHRKRIQNCRLNGFVEDEAELSGSSQSDDTEDSDLDAMDASFIDNATQVTPTQRDVDMRTVYLQSVRSPAERGAPRGRYKLAFSARRRHVDVFSQVPREEDESNYLEDSFCVADEDASSDGSGRSADGRDCRTSSDDEVAHARPIGRESTSRQDSTVAGDGAPRVKTRRRVARLLSSSDENSDAGSAHGGEKSRVQQRTGTGDAIRPTPTSTTGHTATVTSFQDDEASRTSTSTTDSVKVSACPPCPPCPPPRTSTSTTDSVKASACPPCPPCPPPRTSTSTTDSVKASACPPCPPPRTSTSTTDSVKASACPPPRLSVRRCGKQVVFIDSRQLVTAQDVISGLRLRHQVLPLVRQLAVPDYIVSTRLAVRRVTLAEFSNKSKKLKLIANLQQLRESFERPCLIIETEKNSKQHGSNDTHARSMPSGNLAEKFLSQLAQTRLKVLFSDSQDATADILAALSRQEEGKQTTVSLSNTDVSNQQQHILNFYLSLPNVNYAMAFRATLCFRSIGEFLQSSAEVIGARCKMTEEHVKKVLKFTGHPFDERMVSAGRHRPVVKTNIANTTAS